MRAQRAVSLAPSLPKAAWFSLVTASAPPFQARDDVRSVITFWITGRAGR